MSLPPIRYERHDPHKTTIMVRPASPSRAAITITVHQIQDALGNWLMPTITMSHSIPQTTEDIVFMNSIAKALLVACIDCEAMLEFVG
jgi:hypothetical protein